MKLHVAYDRNGRILGAAGEDGDQPAALPGITVSLMDIPEEFDKAEPMEFLHRLRVDVEQRRVVSSG